MLFIRCSFFGNFAFEMRREESTCFLSFISKVIIFSFFISAFPVSQDGFEFDFTNEWSDKQLALYGPRYNFNEK
jgi:hypothetical protein